MNAKKIYEAGSVKFTFNRNSRKWQFTGVNALGQEYTLYEIVPGGLENARKVANQMSGSLKRSPGVDNLARKNIEKIVAAAE